MEGDYLIFPSENFCLTVPKHFVEETLSAVFQKNSGSEKFLDKKVGGGCLNFSSKIFCFTVQNHFEEEPFCAVFRKNSGGEKVYGKEGGGGVSIFSVENFCLKLPKGFVRETFSLSLFSVIEKIYASEGYVTIFRGLFLSHSTEPFRRGTLLCCVSENFW